MHTNLTKWGNSQIKELSHAFDEACPSMQNLRIKDWIEPASILQIANFEMVDMDSNLSGSLS